MRQRQRDAAAEGRVILYRRSGHHHQRADLGCVLGRAPQRGAEQRLVAGGAQYCLGRSLPYSARVNGLSRVPSPAASTIAQVLRARLRWLMPALGY